jgi:hypothetical protein
VPNQTPCDHDSPRIIFETRNEGGQVVGFDALRDYDQAIIAALKLEGVPAYRIQVNWYDSGLFYQTINEDLEGEGLAATHQVCSEESVEWYKTSPGKQGLMKLGDYPCSDGPDFEDAADGLAWFWLPGGQGRRPSVGQIGYIFRTMSELGYPRFEHLSASAFQTGPLPNLDDAIRLGKTERLAMNLNQSGSPGTFWRR